MVKMTKYDLKPIVKTYYDALEEGTILGRKCTRCGHIEFPPYLCCNECGGLDTGSDKYAWYCKAGTPDKRCIW